MDKKELAEVRLNRFIAMCGICSRRKADGLIQQGCVRVNKKVIVALGYKVRLTDFVEVNGRHIYIENNQYLLLNRGNYFQQILKLQNYYLLKYFL